MTDEPKGYSLNPFMPLDEPGQAERAANNGVWVGVLLAIGNIVGAALTFAGIGPGGPVEDREMFTADPLVFGLSGGLVVLALFLAWRVKVKAPIWANALLLIWVSLEVLGKVIGAFAGDLSPSGWIILPLCLIGSILAVRGSLILAKARPERGAIDPETFD